MIPSTREQFKGVVLRRLGAPVVKINVDDQQVDDRIDYALAKFIDYHFDGTHHVYIPHQVTETDKTNKYITAPNTDIISVVGVFPVATTLLGGGIWSFNYQFALMNWQLLFTNLDLSHYFISRQYLDLINQVLVGQQPIRYNRYDEKIYVDMNWDRVATGDFLLFDCYTKINPATFPKVWSDPWLLQYTTAQVKEQWGNNMKKFKNVPGPGGVMLSGQEIYNEAVAEIAMLESELLYSYSLPVYDLIG